jgi:hypothetical protein
MALCIRPRWYDATALGAAQILIAMQWDKIEALAPKLVKRQALAIHRRPETDDDADALSFSNISGISLAIRRLCDGSVEFPRIPRSPAQDGAESSKVLAAHNAKRFADLPRVQRWGTRNTEANASGEGGCPFHRHTRQRFR